MIKKECYTLSNGLLIPKIAFGTWQISNDTVVDAVKSAIKYGYRHIDTAANYENETGIAKAVSSSNIDRKEIFLTTKILAEAKTYDFATAVIEQSLNNLKTDYIDLMLIHSPKPWIEFFRGSDKNYFEENIEVWHAMEEALHSGKIRALGLSNFSQQDIENIWNNSAIKPVVNEIQTYIGHIQSELLDYCSNKNIVVMGFSPIATGDLLNNSELKQIAEKYNASVAQLCIKYLLQKGILPIPKSTHDEYIRQNIELNFTINNFDMKTLDDFPDTVIPLAEKFERIMASMQGGN